MKERNVEIITGYGTADSVATHPDGSGPWPGVLLYMDAFGLRPDFIGMARQLASGGFYVLAPNLYYRSGRNLTFSPAAIQGSERDRIMGLVQSLSNEMVMRDTGAFLEFLRRQPACQVSKVGCVGYCMGGSFALSAAGTYPETIAAAASFHGGRLATDRPDSPHLLAPRMKGPIYVGIAGMDLHFPKEEKDRLENALQSAGVRHTLEVYPNVKHGFAVTGTLAFDPTAADAHWKRLLELFRTTLV